MANPVKSRLLLGGVLLLSSQLLAQTIKVKAPTGTVQAAILKVASDRKLPIVSANPSQIVLADDMQKYAVNIELQWPKGSNFFNRCGWDDKCGAVARIWFEGVDAVPSYAVEFLAEVKKAAESDHTFHMIMTELPSKAN